MTRLVFLAALAVFTSFAQNLQPAKPENVSYLLLNATRGTIITRPWQAVDVAIPVGSLVKPFSAIAYGQSHRMRFPVHECTGENCWLKSGHGRIGLSEAIAYSCNSYFRNLAADLQPESVSEAVTHFGVRGPAHDCDTGTLFGLGSEWRLSPLEIARAYAELARRRTEPGVAEVIEGMRLAASAGTAAAIGSSLHHAAALAKTGTAPCSHMPKSAGDGLAVVIYPADAPRYVLLVEVHGTVGRLAAKQAADLLYTLAGAR